MCQSSDGWAHLLLLGSSTALSVAWCCRFSSSLVCIVSFINQFLEGIELLNSMTTVDPWRRLDMAEWYHEKETSAPPASAATGYS